MRKIFKIIISGLLILFIFTGCSSVSAERKAGRIISKAVGFFSTKNSYLKIKSISFDDTGIKTLPDKVRLMKNLEKISLKNNNLTTLPAFIKDLEKLKEIDLSNNKIKVFPARILEIKNLHKLVLNNNSIESVPEEIKNLNFLQEFHISGNKLSEITAGLNELNEIKYLDLSYNNIKSLPNLSLGNLTWLNVEGNGLQSFPDDIFTPQLFEIKAGKNNLRILPERITNCSALNILNLEENDIYSFPEGLSKLKSLRTLNLSRNKLSYFPSQICEIVSLENLFLNGNQISEVPYLVLKLINLNKLYLDKNNFYSFPSSLYNVGSSLIELSLKNNNINYISPEIKEKMNLDFLFLTGNPLKDLKQDLLDWKKKDSAKAVYNRISGSRVIVL